MTALIHWLYPGDGATCLVVNLTVQIAAAVLVAAVVGGALLRRWPAAQNAVWLACLGFVLVCPLTAFSSARHGVFLLSPHPLGEEQGVSVVSVAPAPQTDTGNSSEASQPAEVELRELPDRLPQRESAVELRGEPAAQPVVTTEPAAEPKVQKSSTAAAQAKPFDFRPWIAAAIGGWAAGVLFLTIRVLHGIVAVRRLGGASTPLDTSTLGDMLADVRRLLGLSNLPPIRLSDRIATPVVAGLFRPTVLLPASLPAAIAPRRLRDILLHECAHVARRDPWVVVLQRLVAIVYWPHPFIHFLNRQLARCREEVCDNWVLRAVRPADYADTLLEVAIHCRDRFGVDMPIGLFDVHGKVEDRVRRLLDRRRDGGVRLPARARWSVLAAGAIFLAVAATFPLVAPARAEKQPAKENQAAGKKPSVKQAAASSSEQPPPAGKSEADKDQKFVEGIAVDLAGKPLAGVHVVGQLLHFKRTAISGPDGRFRLEVSRDFPIRPALLAESQNHSLIGLSDPTMPNMSYPGPKSGEHEALRIVLKPARTVRVKVATTDGKPAAGVCVQALGERYCLPDSRTDQDGQATIRVSPDANVQWVIAWKDNLGFDYYENFRSWPAYQTDPLPATIALRLHKASHVRVRTIDTDGRPVAGVFVAPWTLKIPRKLSYVNFTGCPLVAGSSDASGICDFTWLPADTDRNVGFESYKLGYSCPDQPHWDPTQPPAPVTIRFLKNAEVSGTVHFPDGKPAAGITILGEGRGPNMYFRGSAATDAAGHYRMSVYPRQSTIIAVADRDWAAASCTGVKLDEGKTRDHVDFVLSRGTRIHGRVTIGAGRKPATGQTATLVELGEPLGEDARKFGHNAGNLVRWAQVDEKGNYEFRVGPGRFTLHLPNRNSQTRPIDVNVTGQPELVYDVNAARPDELRVSGRVVNAADGKAVAAAIIYGGPVGATGYAGIEARGDAQGNFSMVRYSDTEKYGYYVRAPEADLAGVAIVLSGSSELTIALRPAATVVGFVYDTKGKPIASEKVTAILGCSDEGCTSINVNAVTDKSGRYRIPSLAVGSQCEICIMGERTFVAQIDVKLDRPGKISARGIVLPAKGAADAPQAGQLRAVPPARPAPAPALRKVPPGGLTFTCTIQDEATGRPVPDAAVAVRVIQSPQKREVLEQTRHTTDAAGQFTFTIRKEHVSVAGNDSKREVFVALNATHPGYVEGRWWGYSLSEIVENINKGKRPSFEHLRLEPGRALTGVVAAPDGTPLADVPIEWDTYPSGPHETQSDNTGRFQVTVPVAGGVSLLIMPREYAPMQLIAGPKQTDVGVLTMKKGVSLSGKVLDADGKPVAGQWVFAQLSWIGPPAIRCPHCPRRWIATRAAIPREWSHLTRFRPASISSGRARATAGDQAAHPTTPIHGVYYMLKIKIDADGAKPFELRAQPTVKVAAQYYGSDGKKTGGPAFDCVGRNLDDIGFSWQKAATAVGSDGRYEVLVPLAMKQAGIMFLSLEKISVRFRRSADAPLQAGQELNLGTLTGDVTDIRIIRYVAPVLLIKISDRAGKPIKSAEVSARYDDASLDRHLDLDFEKQKDGRYRSSSLLPDEKFTVTVTADGYLPQSRSFSLAEGTTSELDLVLSPR